MIISATLDITAVQGYYSICHNKLTLERQINSLYYQRLLSSQDKDSIRNEVQTLEKGIDKKDIIRDPYVLEFLGLEQTPNLYEKDIE